MLAGILARRGTQLLTEHLDKGAQALVARFKGYLYTPEVTKAPVQQTIQQQSFGRSVQCISTFVIVVACIQPQVRYKEQIVSALYEGEHHDQNNAPPFNAVARLVAEYLCSRL